MKIIKIWKIARKVYKELEKNGWDMDHEIDFMIMEKTQWITDLKESYNEFTKSN